MAADALGVSRRLLSFPRPTVLACNGHALAMGAFLLLSCDVRIGAEGAHKIGLSEVRVKLTFPDSGLALAKHRLTAPAYDRCLITGEILDPAGAVTAGFLDAVAPAADLRDHAGAAAQDLQRVDPASHHATKLAIRGPVLAAIDAQIDRLRVPGGGW
jgi:enoyl-CoA hydratase